jgi:5-methylcytosine-specific restriction endonuclease McrA
MLSRDLTQNLAAGSRGLHQVDHVIAEKHRGQMALDDLALSCTVCHRRKGSDIDSVDPETGNPVPLFSPRTQL